MEVPFQRKILIDWSIAWLNNMALTTGNRHTKECQLVLPTHKLTQTPFVVEARKVKVCTIEFIKT